MQRQRGVTGTGERIGRRGATRGLCEETQRPRGVSGLQQQVCERQLLRRVGVEISGERDQLGQGLVAGTVIEQHP